jgi:hypothetical protein
LGVTSVDDALVIIGRLPGVDSQNRRCCCPSIFPSMTLTFKKSLYSWRRPYHARLIARLSRAFDTEKALTLTLGFLKEMAYIARSNRYTLVNPR